MGGGTGRSGHGCVSCEFRCQFHQGDVAAESTECGGLVVNRNPVYDPYGYERYYSYDPSVRLILLALVAAIAALLLNVGVITLPDAPESTATSETLVQGGEVSEED